MKKAAIFTSFIKTNQFNVHLHFLFLTEEYYICTCDHEKNVQVYQI